MEVSQRTILHTQLLILMILLIILGYSYGTVNEDEPQVPETKQQGIEKAGGIEWLQERRSKTSDRTCHKNVRWVLGNPKAAVAITDDERLRRARDVGLHNPNGCYPDEYYSEDFGRCRGCTRCSPGTQHDPQLPCGHGQGQETHCTHCEDGYYQSREGLPILTCQPCSQCDPHATVERACTQRSDTVCGKCQEGWYYRENNICEECTEVDIADPSNKDCYQEPVPTPGPEPIRGPGQAPGTQSHLGSLPQPGPSPSEPVPKVDEASTEPAVSPTVPEKGVDPSPQNTLATGQNLLIAGSVVAAVLLVVVVILCVRKKWKRKGEPQPQPPIDMEERENLYVEMYDIPKEREQGSSDGASRPLPGLVPPSSHQNSSSNESGSSKGHPQDHINDQGEDPIVIKNFVKRDTEDAPDPDPQHSLLDGPLSVYGPLRSYDVVADGAGSQVPNMPAGGSQLPAERVNPSSGVSNREDPVGNYDVAPDPSLPSGCRPPSGFNPLSSLPQHNNPRPPQTRV